jgi:hypothetical protein
MRGKARVCAEFRVLAELAEGGLVKSPDVGLTPETITTNVSVIAAIDLIGLVDRIIGVSPRDQILQTLARIDARVDRSSAHEELVRLALGRVSV